MLTLYKGWFVEWILYLSIGKTNDINETGWIEYIKRHIREGGVNAKGVENEVTASLARRQNNSDDITTSCTVHNLKCCRFL